MYTINILICIHTYLNKGLIIAKLLLTLHSNMLWCFFLQDSVSTQSSDSAPCRHDEMTGSNISRGKGTERKFNVGACRN